jgi:hypothetical protein
MDRKRKERWEEGKKRRVVGERRKQKRSGRKKKVRGVGCRPMGLSAGTTVNTRFWQIEMTL